VIPVTTAVGKVFSLFKHAAVYYGAGWWAMMTIEIVRQMHANYSFINIWHHLAHQSNPFKTIWSTMGRSEIEYDLARDWISDARLIFEIERYFLSIDSFLF
jgi:hypothetical protein